MFRWGNNKPKADSEEEFYKKLTELRSRFQIGATFDNAPVDFEIGEHWTQLKGNCHGLVQFRCFSSDAKESINGVERLTKSAHNFWRKGSFINGHYHEDADEYLYLVHGVLEVMTIENGKSVERVYESDSKQPIIIPRGVKHFVKALTNVSFVVKFIF